MTIEQQVCSLELAQKLKELNVKQESLFYWWQNQNGGWGDFDKPCLEDWNFNENQAVEPENVYCFSAFTVAELDEKLYTYYSTASEKVLRDILLHTSYSNPADARAKILMYLIENKLINLPKS